MMTGVTFTSKQQQQYLILNAMQGRWYSSVGGSQKDQQYIAVDSDFEDQLPSSTNSKFTTTTLASHPYYSQGISLSPPPPLRGGVSCSMQLEDPRIEKEIGQVAAQVAQLKDECLFLQQMLARMEEEQVKLTVQIKKQERRSGLRQFETNPNSAGCPVHKIWQANLKGDSKERLPLSMRRNSNTPIPYMSRQLQRSDLDEKATVTFSIPKLDKKKSKSQYKCRTKVNLCEGRGKKQVKVKHIDLKDRVL